MFDNNYYTYDDNDDLNFEPFLNLSESSDRQREPFPPIMGGGGNFPPMGNFPPNFDTQDSEFYSPNFNYPGGTFNPPGAPKSPPPNYVPHKNDAAVQKMGFGQGGIETKAVSSGSIRFCLFKYTYIWEISGRSYWAYLLNVDRRTVSGFRWFRRSWVYFGLDLRRIDSFVCYRSSEDDSTDCMDLKRDNTLLQNNTKEYSLSGTKDIYSQTLASIDIPEIKEDFITKTVGYADDTKIQSEMPCVKARNINYRVTLEVAYPGRYDDELKNKINELASEVSNEVFNLRSSYNDSTPLESFNSSVAIIPETLKTFSDSFYSKLKLLNSSDCSSDVTCSIKNDKIYSCWKPYFYSDSLL